MLYVGTFAELLTSSAAQFKDSPFLIGDDRLGVVSYKDLLSFAKGLEAQFDSLDIPRGAAVATIFHNCALAALHFFGVIGCGRVLVPLNPISTQSELEYMLDRANCLAVIFDSKHPRAQELRSKHIIPVEDHRQYFSNCLSVAPRDDRSLRESRDDEFCGEVVFTSGSTGRPKGVILSERNLIANATGLIRALGLRSDDRFLTVCPLFHNSGQILTTLACALVGGSTVPVKSDVGMINFWHYVRNYQPQWTLGMVSFLALLLHQGRGPTAGTSMRGLLTGGSVIDAGLIVEFEKRFGIPVRTVYGLTESSSIATCEYGDPSPRSLGSSGRPVPGCDVRIAREDGFLASAGSPLARQPGEILIAGPTLFEGYVGDPALTRARKRDGWLLTGDLGYFDELGNLFVVDRRDSMLIVGGENVYPAEVERLCTQLRGAVQLVMGGVDHPIWGKELVLVYKTENGLKPDLGEWHRILMANVAAFKVPQQFVSVRELGFDDFPRKENGKLDRTAIASALSVRKLSLRQRGTQ